MGIKAKPNRVDGSSGHDNPMSMSFPGGTEGTISTPVDSSASMGHLSEVLGAKRHKPVPGTNASTTRGFHPTGEKSKM